MTAPAFHVYSVAKQLYTMNTFLIIMTGSNIYFKQGRSTIKSTLPLWASDESHINIVSLLPYMTTSHFFSETTKLHTGIDVDV